MNKEIKLEICCFSTQSAINASKYGADRIELCAGRPEGGTTPTVGTIETTLEHVNIPVYVMIRPRGGDFLYDIYETESMVRDIKRIAKLKPNGVVFGALTPSGDIDIDLLKRIMDASDNLPVTFHRAFDMCRRPFEALYQLIELGVENVLTSGQQNKAPDALKMLGDLSKHAAGKINIMAGSGVNPQNMELVIETGIDAVHFSASAFMESQMIYRKETAKMGNPDENEYLLQYAHPELIKEAKSVIEILKRR